MSRGKEVGEVVSAIISLVNNQYSCLVELLGHRQSTKILENVFLTFYFLSVSKNILTFYFLSVSKNIPCFNFFQALVFYCIS